MKIVRYESVPANEPAVGVVVGDAMYPLPVTSVGVLLALGRAELNALLANAIAGTPAEPLPSRLLPPIDGRTEVWASGVTYTRSRTARMEESQDADIYDRVYNAARPELFFKAPSWRVITDGDDVWQRNDSALNVPEPELALVVNADAEIVGLLAANDMSSRSIEGENPLYLPQAKVYDRSCVISNGIVVIPGGEVGSHEIVLRIDRGGGTVFSGTANSSQLHRTPESLVADLYSQLEFPEGAVLSTGTGIVPDLEFVLEDGDVVVIDIEGVGSIRNVVRTATPKTRAFA
ncbi:fumarylacetoacetate hydrolase family protein [Microbacterium sp. BK668]|uniref:fumarylacetoacetate hydrolase family protein n=1 Tax=Microbacterium sp. BK668 TaxID=2512118 RepID=UPI0010F391B9|nr:fumarylacetoacetate hydrolase family protein [Microbacterium sp. BK668]TDN91556.1 2-dehydro-3-deoxy-D-arabinonate dehydratase [Microbacterium sp. BK668]